MKNYRHILGGLFTIALVFVFSAGYGQFKIFADGSAKVGETGVAPIEMLDVAGNLALSSPETGGTGFQNRNHVVYGKGGSKRLQFSSDESTTASWAWIQMFGSETCADCPNILKRGNLSMGGQKIIIRSNNTAASFGDIAVEIDNAQNMIVTGTITSLAPFTMSDPGLTKSKKALQYGLKEVLSLNPVKYENVSKKGLNLDKGPMIGVMADELEKIDPDFVRTVVIDDWRNNVYQELKAVNTSAIQSLLINAIKEQQVQIDAKNVQIAELNEMYTDLVESVEDIRSLVNNYRNGVVQTNIQLTHYDFAELEQNTPNPFSGYTSIEYVVPTEAKNASIEIFNMNGVLIRSIDLQHRGEGKINIEAINIPSGNYSYNLVVDNRILANKKMISQN